MDEQTSWRGHSFTLFVFVGIAFLCATFFVLGMLVGRSQGQKYASAAAADAVKPRNTVPDKVDFNYEALKKDTSPPAKITAEPAEPLPPPEARVAETAEVPAPASVSIQVEALQQRTAAEKLVGELKRLGFTAFVIPPAAGERNGLYRVQVGPYADADAAESSRQKLQASGYHPIIKK